MSGGHSEVVPRLPIPNRTVKRLSADDSADTRVKVGHRQTPQRQSPAQTSWALCIGAADGYGENGRPPMAMPHLSRDLPRPGPDVTSPCGQRWPQRPPPFAALPSRSRPGHWRHPAHLPTSLGHDVTHPMPACGRPPDAPAAYVGLRESACFHAVLLPFLSFLL